MKATLFHQSVDSNLKVFDDYYKFFTSAKGQDMLEYAYIGYSDSYENLITSCSNYYLFSDEVAVIKNNTTILETLLVNVCNVIEIGPGSIHAVKNKTIPILRQIYSLKNYYPVDFCHDYLVETCNYLRSEYPDLTIKPIEENLLQCSTSKIKNYINDKNQNAVLFLGGTIGNFLPSQQDLIIDRISNILNKDDLFLITVDTNLDNKSLLTAYNHQYNDIFIKGILLHFVKINSDFAPHVGKFISKCVIHENGVEMFLVATESFTFYLPNYGNILIKERQELRSIKSRKFSINQVTSLLEKNNFVIVDILNNSDKIKIFICKKN